MERSSDKDESRRKFRDERDRNSSKEYRDRDHKSRDAEEDRHHKHHHSSKNDKYRGGDDDRIRPREDRDEYQRSAREYSLDRDDREHRRQREKSHEPRNERGGSRERSYEREGSRDRVSRADSSKRKERGSENHVDGSHKRARGSDGVKEETERRRFEDRVEHSVKESNGSEREPKREKRRFDDRVKDGESNDVDVTTWEGKKERRKFDDRVKQENTDAEGGSEVGNGLSVEPLSMISKTLPETSLASDNPPVSKVSLISTTNENKGVSVTRSHEVPGKSSTDGTTSAAGKSGSISLDALAKAKKALQMQKVLSEKLKKIPLLNKGARSTSDNTMQVGLKEDLQAPSFPQGSASGTAARATSASTFPASAKPPISSEVSQTELTPPNFEAVKRAQEFAAKLGFRQDPQFAPLINMFPGQIQQEITLQPKPGKAPVLRLDALGREVDEHGNVVNMTKVTNLSTLKVNINKQKKEAFQILKPELDVDPEKNPHFDLRMGIDKNKLLRPKRMNFQFVEEGKWSKDAEIIKLKSQFGEAQAKELRVKQAQLAKAKAEPDINPNLIEVSERVIIKEKPKEPIPEVEWWDVPFLSSGTYGDASDGNISEQTLKTEKITIYVVHPRPIEPPSEPAPPPPQPLKLTKKEQKKLRTQRRLAREKDRQEMIRQGLIEPPKPKVKMSNLMKVLGTEATQDPTKLEMQIRSAAAEREQAHVDRNIARKLTPAERREKKERKLFDDPSNTLETVVSVYKINDLSHPQTRFKVDVNAQENRLTGCAVISDGVTVVAVEGGMKSIKRYGKVMMKRINWAAAVENEDGDGDEEDNEKPVNKCVLVWQGSVAKPSFNRFHVHECRSEAAARKVFSDGGVAHYWDLAVNFTEDQM